MVNKIDANCNLANGKILKYIKINNLSLDLKNSLIILHFLMLLLSNIVIFNKIPLLILNFMYNEKQQNQSVSQLK